MIYRVSKHTVGVGLYPYRVIAESGTGSQEVTSGPTFATAVVQAIQYLEGRRVFIKTVDNFNEVAELET